MRDWLKKYRIQKFMTHHQVAIESKISRPYYTEIENGNKNPSVLVAKKIAEVLDFEWTIFFVK